MASASPGLFYFNTDTLPQRDRFPVYYEEIVGRWAGLDLNAPDQSRFHASLEARRAGVVDIGYHSNAALDTARTAKHIRDGNDGLCLVLLEDGAAHYQSARDEPAKLGPGDAMLCDYGYGGEYNFVSDAHAWSLKIPRIKIGNLLTKIRRLDGARLDSDPIARKLLFSYLPAVRSIDFSSSLAAGNLFGEHIIDLIALAIGAEGDACRQAEEGGARYARRAAILREIERRSGERRLSAAGIALQLGITPRYVHLLLEETGHSFTQHLLDVRLQRAAALLRQFGTRYRKIADIAVEAGLNDFSYFSRVFRRHFGMTPTDMREETWPETKP